MKEILNITFKVKGPRDAHIGLFVDTQSNFGGEAFYKIFFGGWGNTRCALAPTGESAKVTETNNAGYMSTAEFRSFWISWADNTISIGSGAAIGQSTLLSSNYDTAKGKIIQMAFTAKDAVSNQFKYNNGWLNFLFMTYEYRCAHNNSYRNDYQ